MIVFFILLALLAFTILLINSAKFGALPKKNQLDKITASTNYSKGKFQNVTPTPDLTEGETYLKIILKVLFKKDKRNKPQGTIPHAKNDLHKLDLQRDCIVWFGHSSYLLQVGGKRFLIDPVFSGAASPIPATTRSFSGSDAYSAANMPAIDLLVITHDHWDHLDYDTVSQLKTKVRHVLCPLGVAAHLNRWGFSSNNITESDWDDSYAFADGFIFHLVTARHFSGRSLKRNQSLWTSYVLVTPTKKIFLGGDSGYGAHFKEIGAKYGPFDLAVLECGQYDESWKYIHLLPEETVTAALDLGSKMLMPVHWGKFSLGNHAWDDPILRVSTAAAGAQLPLFTPMIGEIADLNDDQKFLPWWENVDQ